MKSICIKIFISFCLSITFVSSNAQCFVDNEPNSVYINTPHTYYLNNPSSPLTCVKAGSSVTGGIANTVAFCNTVTCNYDNPITINTSIVQSDIIGFTIPTNGSIALTIIWNQTGYHSFTINFCGITYPCGLTSYVQPLPCSVSPTVITGNTNPTSPNTVFGLNTNGYRNLQWSIDRGAIFNSSSNQTPVSICLGSGSGYYNISATGTNSCGVPFSISRTVYSDNNDRTCGTIAHPQPTGDSNTFGNKLNSTKIGEKSEATTDEFIINTNSSIFKRDNILHITLSDENKTSESKVDIYDLQGRIYKTATVMSNQIEINTNDLNNGLYLARISSGDYSTVHKFTVLK